MSEPECLVAPARCVFVAPVRSSFYVDMPSVIGSGFATWEALWERELGGWRPALPSSRSNGLVFDVDDYRGAGRQPHLASAQLDHDLDLALSGFEIESAELHLYDFGLATVVIEAVTSEERPTTYPVLLAAIEASSTRLATQLARPCEELLSCFDRLVDDDVLKRAVPPSAALGIAAPNTPLWVHRLLLAEERESQHGTRIGHSCFSEGARLSWWDGGDVRLWIGHGSSVVEAASLTPETSTSAIRVLDVATAWWAGAQLLGSVFLQRHHELVQLRRVHDLKGLERHADRVIELHDELALFQTLVQDEIARLDITERNIFEAVSGCWRFGELLTDVERRRHDLATIHDQALRGIQAIAATRLNLVVFVLTAVSAVAIITEMWAFIRGEGPGAIDWTRLAVVATSSSIVAVGAWLVAFRRNRA